MTLWKTLIAIKNHQIAIFHAEIQELNGLCRGYISPRQAPGPQEVPPGLLRSGRRGLCRAEWRPAAAPDVGGEGREAPLSGTETWRKILGKSWENWGNHGKIARENRVWILKIAAFSPTTRFDVMLIYSLILTTRLYTYWHYSHEL